MFTHIHTTEWEYTPNYSSDTQSYFINRVDGRILAELKASNGFEYYICSNIQMQKKVVGNYIGCVKSSAEDGKTADIMVYNHSTQQERTISLNDEKYLD